MQIFMNKPLKWHKVIGISAPISFSSFLIIGFILFIVNLLHQGVSLNNILILLSLAWKKIIILTIILVIMIQER